MPLLATAFAFRLLSIAGERLAMKASANPSGAIALRFSIKFDTLRSILGPQWPVNGQNHFRRVPSNLVALVAHGFDRRGRLHRLTGRMPLKETVGGVSTKACFSACDRGLGL